jgi:hypothetical protein
MKSKENKKITQIAAAFSIVFLARTLAVAQSATAGHPPPPHFPPGYFLGVCVDQALQAQGIVISYPKSGQAPTPPSDSVRQAEDQARETCMNSMPRPPMPTQSPGSTTTTNSASTTSSTNSASSE